MSASISDHDGHSSSYSKMGCSLCLESYDRKMPKMLPCFHTFCESCLDEEIRKTSDQQKFKCPFCDYEIDRPEKGATAFQTNLYIAGGTPSLATLCEVCEDGQKADAKCVNCQQFLCRSCTTAHQKWSAMQDHCIENLVENETNLDCTPIVMQQPTKKKMRCYFHHSQYRDLFCTTCRVAVCQPCRDDKHKKHTVIDLQESAAKPWRNLRSLLGRKEQYLEWWKAQRSKIETAKNLRETTTIGLIEERVKSLHKQIDDIAEKRIEEAKVDTSGINAELTIYSGQIKGAKMWLQSASDLDLLVHEELMINSLESMPMNLPLSMSRHYEMEFNKGIIDRDDLERMVGETIVRDTVPKELSVQRVHAFQVQMPGIVRCVCPVGKGQSWVTVFGTPGATLYDARGMALEILFPDSEIDTVTAAKKGGVIFASLPEEKVVYKINPDTDEADIFLELVYHPRGIAVSSNGCLIVCSVVSKGFDEYTEFHINAILICDPSGEVVRQIKGIESTPFAYPYRIAVDDVNDRFMVLDVTKGSIHMFNWSGEVTKTYDREEHGRSDISDIACDRHGNILLASNTDRCVQLVGLDGTITNILEGEPHCIAVSESGYLWIGSRDVVEIFRYLDVKQ